MAGAGDVDFEGLELIEMRLEIDVDRLIQVRAAGPRQARSTAAAFLQPLGLSH